MQPVSGGVASASQVTSEQTLSPGDLCTWQQSLHQLLTPVQKDKQKQAIDLTYVKLPYSVKFSRDKIFVEINFADQVAA